MPRSQSRRADRTRHPAALCRSLGHALRRAACNSLSCWIVLAALAAQAADAEIDIASDAGLPTVDARVRAAATSAKVLRYAQRVIADHDANQDGILQQSEWSTLKGDPSSIDLNGDGTITVDEFALHVARFATPRRIRLLFPESPPTEDVPLLQPKSAPAEPAAKTDAAAKSASGERAEGTDVAAADTSGEATAPAKAPPRRRDTKFFVPASRLPQNLPAWFHARDKDGDGQITMAEYAESMTPATLAEFNRLDRNGDGVITAAELVQRSGNGTHKSKTSR